MKERMRKFIDSKCMSIREFERECGVSSGLLNNMERGFGKKTQRRIFERFPELNPEWLILGTGEMLRTPQNSVNILNGDNNTNNGHISVLENNVEQLKNENEALKAENAQLKSQIAQLTDIISKLASK